MVWENERNMNPTVDKIDTNTARFVNPINASILEADENGQQKPLQLVPSGTWTDSWKGTIDITLSDLLEMDQNFKQGVGLAGGGVAGAPIDYAHAEWDKAAGWILETAVINGFLCATKYEWTTEASEAIKSGEWKFFSPSFVPICIGSWCDPEDPTITARNVLLGGGLTNKPFFKGLTGLINASQTREGNDGSQKIYISANAQGEIMNAEVSAILAKDPSTITADERKVLADNRAQLKADDIVKFDVDKKETPVVTATPPAPIDASQYPQEVKDALALQASIAGGTHQIVAKSEFEGLKASVQVLEDQRKAAEKAQAEAHVDEAIRAGQIVTGDRDQWVGIVQASETGLTLLKNLPKQEKLGKQQGADAGESQIDASAQLDAKVKALMASENITDYGKAAQAVLKAEPELAQAYVAERGY